MVTPNDSRAAIGTSMPVMHQAGSSEGLGEISNQPTRSDISERNHRLQSLDIPIE